MKHTVLFMLLGVCCMFPAASAQDAAAQPSNPSPPSSSLAVEDESVAAYLVAIKRTRGEVASGGYGKLQRGDAQRFDAAVDEILTLLEGHASFDELPQNEKLALYNAQQLVEGILQDQRENATVCRRAAKTGTRLTQTQCMSVADAERQRREHRESAERMVGPAGCNGDGVGCFGQ